MFMTRNCQLKNKLRIFVNLPSWSLFPLSHNLLTYSLSFLLSLPPSPTPLHHTTPQLEIYQAFIEEVLRQTSEDHIDYRSLGSALEAIQDLKTVS